MSWNKAGVRFFLGNVHIFTWSLQKVVLPGQILYIEKKGGSVTSMECFFLSAVSFLNAKEKVSPPKKGFSEPHGTQSHGPRWKLSTSFVAFR